MLAKIKPQVPSEQKALQKNSDLSAKLGTKALRGGGGVNSGMCAHASAVSTQNRAFSVIIPPCRPPPRCPLSEAVPDHGAQVGNGPGGQL